MLKNIFKRTDFVLCYVPVPNGYPQSQTHCSVQIVNETFYMTTSPYPCLKRSTLYCYVKVAINKFTFGLLKINDICGENYENPCIYVSIKDSLHSIPIKFTLFEGSPLMSKPEDKYGLGSYCSDPDLYYENDMFYVLNRTSLRKKNTGNPYVDYETNVYLIKCSLKKNRAIVQERILLFSEQYASPCITKYNGKYVYFCLKTNSYNNGLPCDALYKKISNRLESGWGETSEIIIEKGNYEPWHMSLFQYEGELFTIIACVKKGESHRCWQMLGKFDKELKYVKIYQTPLTDYKSYRSAATVTSKGEFVLYNTTVYEKIRRGRSVDGREIIMAHMPFKELLKQLIENE